MSLSRLTLAVKATLDRLVNNFCQSEGLDFIDLSGDITNITILESRDSGIAWSFNSLQESPRHPLYSLSFDIGVKTVNDPVRYASLEYMSKLQELIKKGTFIDVKDYAAPSTSPPTEDLGTIYVAATTIQPQMLDRSIGVRFLAVSALFTSAV